MNSKRLTIYDATWQSIRVSLLKENHHKGGWTTYGGTLANINAIKSYLESKGLSFVMLEQYGDTHVIQEYLAADVPHMCAALYRVVNCLNAVRMGYSGQGLKNSAQDMVVQRFRDEMSALFFNLQEWNDYTFEGITNHKAWEQFQLSSLRRLSHEQFSAIYYNLAFRRDKAIKNNQQESRPELFWYVDLMKQVMRSQ
jgi:hypothetical protein